MKNKIYTAKKNQIYKYSFCLILDRNQISIRTRNLSLIYNPIEVKDVTSFALEDEDAVVIVVGIVVIVWTIILVVEFYESTDKISWSERDLVT